jgi:hypothetical protein
MGELTATAFLGVRLECAQCHKHPFDRWTQADYRSWANVFGQTKFGSSPEVTAAVANLLEERRKVPPGKAGPRLPRMREVYVSNAPLRRLRDPESGGPLPAKVLGGPEIALEGDARAKLCDWLTAADNPYFARTFVNRVWAHYFGVGLVGLARHLDALEAEVRYQTAYHLLEQSHHPQLLDAGNAPRCRSNLPVQRRKKRKILTGFRPKFRTVLRGVFPCSKGRQVRVLLGGTA